MADIFPLNSNQGIIDIYFKDGGLLRAIPSFKPTQWCFVAPKHEHSTLPLAFQDLFYVWQDATDHPENRHPSTANVIAEAINILIDQDTK